ncbi:MAG TPA: DUF6544 family protein [Noviherbaspirillum sp.]|jgi:hypothetical protein|uniref:DUF6544 family protein n=1 Tax=Noviherbaspirillum sp. TaxID=1926288 RepID=UPI002F921174
MAARAKWGLASVGAVGAALLAAVRTGRSGQVRAVLETEHRLLDRPRTPARRMFRMDDLKGLPAPVARYLQRTLTEGQALVRVARFRQHGALRTAPDSERWMAFEATQLSAPFAPGFLWQARVALAGPFELQVRDTYVDGAGSTRLTLLSAFVVQEQPPGSEINRGALQRYLAEAPWYPTALLPAAGVRWSAIDARRAQATLKDHGTSISLEFRFNEDGDVESVHTPARWRSTRDGFVRERWEARFRDYHRVAGMRIPLAGEAGWYAGEDWQCVWKGEIRDIAYEVFHTDQ